MQQNQTCLQQKVVTNETAQNQIFLQQKYFKFIPRKLMRLFRTNCFVDDTVCPKVLLKREKEIFLLNFLNKT